MSTTNDWIEWNGGTNPAPGKIVLIQTRGKIRAQELSDDVFWSHTGQSNDVVKYFVLGNAPRKPLTQDEPMTKRERIAALMMGGLLSSYADTMMDDKIATWAVECADALIAELKRRKEPSHEQN